MATITNVCRKSGNVYKAVMRLRGIKSFSKTFKLRKNAKAWAERKERNIDEARAHGNDRVRVLTLKELVRAYERHYSGKNMSAIFCLSWWVREIGGMKLVDITKQTIRAGLRKLETREVRHRDGKRKIKSFTKTRARPR